MSLQVPLFFLFLWLTFYVICSYINNYQFIHVKVTLCVYIHTYYIYIYMHIYMCTFQNTGETLHIVTGKDQPRRS